MRILGIDYGSKRHGLSVSDALGITAQPLTTLTRKNDGKDLAEINVIIEERDIGMIVIGLPRNMDGSEAVHFEDVEKYKSLLEEETGLPVVTWEERLSTAQVERMLISADTSRKKRKKVIDKLAASVILQSYMDANPDIVNDLKAKT